MTLNGQVMTKLAPASETVIAFCFLVMNLKNWLASLYLFLFLEEKKAILESEMGAFNAFAISNSQTL
jgi:hypothetical protein